MYQAYFSLERHPFRITPDTSLFFSGGIAGRGVVLEAMLYAIASGEGILKVVGEVGSGKTMLCRMLEEQLPQSTEVVYIANPNLSPEEILYAVAFELKLPVRRDTSKLLVMQQLQNHLLKQHSENKNVLVIIEEAQGMPVETLEEIRLFSNLETHRDKLMQIILFGQPELDKNLGVKHIRQLRERITHSFYLAPMDGEQTADYIRFRLGAAGCPCPRLFTTQAEWLIAKSSGGLTRRINILADKAMLAAFSEDVLKLPEKLGPDVPPVITAKHVLAAIRDSEYSLSIIDRLFSPLRIASASLMAVAMVVTIMLWPRTAGIASILPVNDVAPSLQPNLIVEKKFVSAAKASQWAVKPSDNVPALQASAFPVDLALSMPLLPFDTLTPPAAQPELPKVARPINPTVAEPVNLTPQLSSLVSSLKDRDQTRNSLMETRAWLEQAGTSGYTIQFLSGASADLSFAESFLNLMTQLNLENDSIVCVSSENEQAYWTIKHGNFSGLSVANDYIEQLPQKIRDYKPFVQNLSGIECNSNDEISQKIQELL